MTKTLSLALMLLAAAAPVGSSETLQMSVTPQMTTSPAMITVRISVEPSDENRAIRITTDSLDYFRGSEIELDGSSSRTTMIRYRDLPAGEYHVRSVLIGRDGKPRGSVERDVMVMP